MSGFEITFSERFFTNVIQKSIDFVIILSFFMIFNFFPRHFFFPAKGPQRLRHSTDEEAPRQGSFRIGTYAEGSSAPDYGRSCWPEHRPGAISVHGREGWFAENKNSKFKILIIIHDVSIIDQTLLVCSFWNNYLSSKFISGMMFAWGLESGQEQITYKGHNGAVFSMDVFFFSIFSFESHGFGCNY